MNESIYKNAFLVALIVCLLLAGALTYVVWTRQHMVGAAENSPVMARGPEAASTLAAFPSDVPPPLAPIQLSPERLQAIGVKTTTVEMRNVSDELSVPGNVDVNERQLAFVQTRFPGWIQKVFVNATYQYVRKGQPLFTVYSPELVSTEQEYVLAKQNRESFANDAHGTAMHESDWLLQAAADRLRQYGVPVNEIARLQQTGKVQPNVTIESPVSGYVTEFTALPNAYVQAESKLYTIADLSSIWVYGNVPQDDLGQLKPGTSATVIVDAYPGRNFKGRVDQVLPQVDPMSRTARVRFVFGNPGVVLKPGMYVRVNMAVPLGRQLVVPASGVLHSGTRQIAFLDHGNGYLEPREIEVGPRLDDHMVVFKGLKAGDRIVSSANFLVDSESQLQAAIGAFSPPSTTATPAPSAPQPTIEFTSDPSPPHKGNNVVRVRITTADRKGITGAEVTVTFFMPAMPAMGMAAEKAVATLADKGNGTYQGPLPLPMGGSWQVTVLAKRGGQTIASKQLNVNATGGM